jgi:23S rRNA pseudouridine2457 synthase
MLIAFNKPYGVLSQFTPEPGSKWRTLKEYGLPKQVYPLGRLDADSEGLLLLSDEPGLNSQLLNPALGHKRTYWAQVDGIPTAANLDLMEKGVTVHGRKTLPCAVRLLDPPPILSDRKPPIRARKSIPTSWIELTLTEGKNRQVRKMTAAIGFPTLRLIRVKIGRFELVDLEPGCWRELSVQERQAVFA